MPDRSRRRVIRVLPLALAALPALLGAQEPRLVLTLGHGSILSSASFSADGSMVATGSMDGTAVVWDVATGSEIRRFGGGADLAMAVDFAPTGSRVAGGRMDGLARLWEVGSGDELASLGLGDASFSVTALVFLPGGERVLTGSADGPARLWDLGTGTVIRTFEPDIPLASKVDVSADGEMALTQGPTGLVQVWEVESGRELGRIETGAPPQITYPGPRFSPDGSLVVTVDATGPARLWEWRTGRLAGRFGPEGRGVFTAAFSPDGSALATAALGAPVTVWQVATGEELARFGSGTGIVVEFGPDGELLLTGDGDGSVRLWDVGSGELAADLRRRAWSVTDVAFGPGGRRVLVGSEASSAYLWDLETGSEERRLTVGARAVAFAPDRSVAATVTPAGTVRLTDVESDEDVREIPHGMGYVQSLAFSPDGRRLAAGGLGGDVRVWDASSGEEVARSSGQVLYRVAFSADGRRLIESRAGVPVTVRELESGQVVAELDAEIPISLSLAPTPDPDRLLTGRADGTARLWDVPSGRELRVLDGHDAPVWGVAVSADGRLALTGSDDGTAVVWDLDAGRSLHVLRGHDRPVVAVAFSPDGRWALTGGRDGSARLWDVGTGAELASMVSFMDEGWAVVAPSGRFDASDLEELGGLNWILPDDPLTPLPVEIFMRDYYEPRLLPRLLAREAFPELPGLLDKNRVQPGVEVIGVEAGADGTASVTVRVRNLSRRFRRGGREVPVESGVHDVRVFRDRRLVAWTDGAVEVGADGTATLRYPGIALPRSGGSRLEFSAYAFNDDRVKSPTVREEAALPAGLPARPRRAWLVTVGVDAYESPEWNLRFAANDAWLLSEELGRRLEGEFDEVIRVPLVAAHAAERDTEATGAAIRGVLAALAGESGAPPPRGVPGAERLAAATPDDLVFVSFSSHGYADAGGTFYLFPSDIGEAAEKTVTEALLERAVSSDELARWLRPVDAGEIVLVVDACHSAAAVEGAGFKPGPMGSRGLGQLAWDKGMRILAASQAEDVALESDLIRQGLLTHALVRDGLEASQADHAPADGRIDLGEWLLYGAERVPGLYAEVQRGEVQTFGREVRSTTVGAGQRDPHFQQPALFDFRRTGLGITLRGGDGG